MIVHKDISTLRIGFSLLVVLYFLNYFLDWRHGTTADILKTLPVLFLCLASFKADNFRIHSFTLALLFSATGDLLGELRLFIPQIATFVIAHLFYAYHFLRKAHVDYISSTLILTLVTASICIGTYITPYITAPCEQIACIAYIVIISVMTASTILLNCRYKWLYVIAALVFMASDTCIAINRFVVHLPYATAIIMSTYFTAQYTFARLYIGERYK